ncbi:MAG: HU family DNA-binding protein [Actinomycetota bacterium]|nr:HU family DNA-binding protein [Actinomycetota bacterium]
MNRAQLIEELSGRFEGNKKQAQHALESVIDVIQRTLVKGEKVAITGFGAFERIERPARTARNPKTGASVKVKKTAVPKFRAGSDLKAIVSGAKKLPKQAAAKKTTPAAGGAGAAGTATKRAGKAAEVSAEKATPARARKSAAADGAADKTAASKTATKSTAKKTAPAGGAGAAKKAAATTGSAKKTAARFTAKKAAAR